MPNFVQTMAKLLDGRTLLNSLSETAVSLRSAVADGASAVATILDTAAALTTSGAKLLSVRNAGAEKASIDKDGTGTFTGEVRSSQVGLTSAAPTLYVATWSTAPLLFRGGTAAADCVHFMRGVGDAQSKVNNNGEYECVNADKGIILKSANGTRHRITVSDAGVLVVTAL